MELNTIFVGDNFTTEQLDEQKEAITNYASALGLNERMDKQWVEVYFYAFRDMIVAQLARKQEF